MGDPTLLARAATETGREGREIAYRDRRDGVGGFERAWAGSGLVAVGARLAPGIVADWAVMYHVSRQLDLILVRSGVQKGIH